MGVYEDKTAKHLNMTREQQDAYATQSMTRALQAQADHLFDAEIAPVTIHDQVISLDECPRAEKLAKMSRLRPAFGPEGTVTAANSSSISDGAASLILMTAANAQARGLIPLAKIVAQATHAHEPQWFTTAPIKAIQSVLNKAQWTMNDVDLYEINEAFAVVTMAAINALELDPEKVNRHGGACALGHPIGASGARILVTLIHALIHQKKKRGVAALCIGGGEATAIAIERLS
jgi:acetyl-CoA C-acetyltransferase